MTLALQVRAIRESVALSRLDHVRYVRVTGTGAYEALDRVVSGTLRVRDGQLRHVLLLTDQAHPLADAYVGREDEDYFILAEGIGAAELVDHIRQHSPPGGDVSTEDCSATHAILAVEGPYAWELLGYAIDPEIIGLPYLTFYHREGMPIYRAGKSGEFGYGLIVPRQDLGGIETRLRSSGTAFDLRDVGLEALDHAALENFFFNIRREGREPVTPLELQLQWRVNYSKECVGASALRHRRDTGITERLTCLLADGEVAAGCTVMSDGTAIGRVVNAGFSEARNAWVALALMDRAWAYPGLDGLTAIGSAAAPADPVAARTVSPPVLLNRSLLVSPQLHSYATRHELPLPTGTR